MIRNIYILLLLTFGYQLQAVSAPPEPYYVSQPDGTNIPVQMYGHEYYNWIETEDGYVIDWVEDDARLGWYYSELDNGNYSPSNIPVVYPAPPDFNIPKHLREMSPHVRKFGSKMLHPNDSHSIHTDRSLLKPLVFLVDFDNLPSGVPDREYSKEQFRQLLFEPDLESDGSTLPSIYDMSVRDYYHEISNDSLEVFGEIGRAHV